MVYLLLVSKRRCSCASYRAKDLVISGVQTNDGYIKTRRDVDLYFTVGVAIRKHCANRIVSIQKGNATNIKVSVARSDNNCVGSICGPTGINKPKHRPCNGGRQCVGVVLSTVWNKQNSSTVRSVIKRYVRVSKAKRCRTKSSNFRNCTRSSVFAYGFKEP